MAEALHMRDAGLKYREIAALLGVSIEQARGVVLRAQHLRDHPHWGQKLSTRLANGLKNTGCNSEDELAVARAAAALGAKRWAATYNFGKKSHAELIEWLTRHGLALAP
jgi:hypothetical protein